MASSRTFFITGVSSGLGRALADAALADGHRVVGTVRSDADAAAFTASASASDGRALARVLDVTDDAAVLAAIDGVEATVGPIDVLVANAGYGHEGTVEESTMEELRQQFAVNVFGAVAAIKAVLPHMRARRAGHIVTITSMGGLVTMPGLAFYHGSKYALEGISESLGREVDGLGIHVTAVAPGSFRTEWAGRSMVRAPSAIPDYEPVFAPLRANRRAASGNQLGDPARAAAAILAVVDAPEPPAHLVLGSDALRLVAAGRAAVDADIAAWDAVSRSTDLPDGAQIR
jgi:NAD(P)-dependent dehydrogenase (short-subunit alcohol dehydrogenase family)